MKKTGKLLAIAFLFLMAAACQYDFIVPEEIIPVEPGTEISFTSQVLPIFTTNNNCTMCHKAGGKSPELTADKAYAQINTSKYINRATPDQSLLYKAVAPGQGFAGHKTVTASQAALILGWIQQGAKNN